MAEEFGIDIIIDPGPSKAGGAAVRAELDAIEKKGKITSKAVSEVASALSGASSGGAGGAGIGVNLKSIGEDGAAAADKFKKSWTSATNELANSTAQVSKLDQVTGALTGTLGKLGLTLGVALAVKKVTDYSDAYTNLQNRLSTVTEGSEELALVTDELFRLANDTRSSFAATGQFYARLAANTKDLGLSQGELLDVTSTLTKALKVSGAGAGEANAAMIQLSQGLASGTLRGDELNSVLEQAPILGREIAESMGIPFGKLREVASQGKITAAEVITALQDMKGEIDEQFSKTAPTFGDLFTKIENRLVLFAGKLAPILAPIVDVFDSLIGVAGPALDIIASGFGAIGAVAGPIVGVLTDALGLAADLLGVVSKIISGLGGVRAELADALGGDINDTINDPRVQAAMKAQTDANTAAIKQQVGQYSELELAIGLSRIAELERAGFSTGVSPQVLAALKAQKAEYERLGEAGVKSLVEINTIMGTLPGTIANIKIKQITDDFKAFEAVEKSILPVNAATKELRLLTEQLTRAVEAHTVSEEDAIEVLHAKQVALSDLKDPVATRIGQLKAETDNMLEQAKASGAELEFIKERQRLLAAGVPLSNADEVALARAVKAHHDAEAALKKHTDAQKKHREELITSGAIEIALDKDRGRGKKLRTEDLFVGNGAVNDNFEAMRLSAELSEELASQHEAAIERAIAAEEKWRQTSIEGGARAGLASLGEEIRNVGDMVSSTFTQGFGLAEDAFLDFLTTGELSFGEFTEFMLRESSKILLRLALIKSLQFAAGGGLGSGIADFANLLGFAQGGTYIVPGSGGPDSTVAAFRVTPGEEINFTPPGQRGRAANQNDGGGGRGGPLNVRVVNVHDPRESLSVIDSPAGERVVMNQIRRNAAAIKRMLK